LHPGAHRAPLGEERADPLRRHGGVTGGGEQRQRRGRVGARAGRDERLDDRQRGASTPSAPTAQFVPFIR
jgi:hypothetical protein